MGSAIRVGHKHVLLVLFLVLLSLTVPKAAKAETIVVFITSTTSSTWLVPQNFGAPWSIEAIGGGAAGGGAQGDGGGGGGAYAKITDANLTLTASTTVYIQVGAGGPLETDGEDTWLNKYVAAPATSTTNGLRAKAGSTTPTTTGGIGGTTAKSIGATTYAGGNGGLGNASDGAGGGGGAAGSTGAGKDGGSAGITAGFEGGGGGGSNGGSSTAGGDSNDTTGGVGGSGTGGSGGGAGATAGSAAVAGTVGGGGGGGFSNTQVGAAGGESVVWTNIVGATSGSGGGGGGAGDSASGVGGDGGLYGGGGGGQLGLGAQGIIVVTYTGKMVRFTATTTIQGTVSVTGSLSKGSGTFVIDHPLDPKNKLLYHSFVESPDVKNLYDGIATLDGEGKATIELPSYFLALNKDFRYLATPIGSPTPNLHLSKGVRKYFFGLFGAPTLAIAGGKPGGRVSWQVTGIRHDPLILAYPIIPEVMKGPGALMEKGKYVCPECYSK